VATRSTTAATVAPSAPFATVSGLQAPDAAATLDVGVTDPVALSSALSSSDEQAATPTASTTTSAETPK
jgi:hypothetical protein